jgi:hypothetical protein
LSRRHIEALELASQGHWDDAHAIVQSASDRVSCLIHGYLHRLEGDQGNARYWYQRGGEDLDINALQAEWERLFRIASEGD